MNFSDLTIELVSTTLEHLGNDALVGQQRIRLLWAPYMEQPVLGQIRTNLEEPSAFVAITVAASIDDGAVLTFQGKDYKVVNRDPPQNGLVCLVLRPDHDD